MQGDIDYGGLTGHTCETLRFPPARMEASQLGWLLASWFEIHDRL